MKLNYYIITGLLVLLGVAIFVIVFSMQKNREACISERKVKCEQEQNKDFIEVEDYRPTIIYDYKPDFKLSN